MRTLVTITLVLALIASAACGQGQGAAPAAGEVSDGSWGFSFKAPAGWKFQKSARGAVLGHDTIAGLILVIPHLASNMGEVERQLQKGYAEESAQLQPAGAVQRLAHNAAACDYTGSAKGQPVQARCIGVLSPYGGGAYVLAATSPDRFGGELPAAADAIARSLVFLRMDVAGLMQQFAGTWVTMTTNTETKLFLSPTGEFADQYESCYTGTFGPPGERQGSWGTASQDRKRGQWAVRGSREEGLLFFRYSDGTESLAEYRVHVSKGQVYWNEYLINGRLYYREK